MIQVTRMNGSTLMLNADLIESLEETPDTVVTLTTGHKFIVKESAAILRQKTIEYKQEIFTRFLDRKE